MEYRYLGRSGLKVSALTYGNWLTHGSQVENHVAAECVRAALEVGITSFDTADSYANGVAEEVLGDCLKGERRESLEIFTKVYWPTGPRGHNDTGLSRKHIFESIHGSLRRLDTDYVDLYQAHRFDSETPLEETLQAFADIVRQGKALYIGVSEWTADQIRAGQALARDMGIPTGFEPAAVLTSLACNRSRRGPDISGTGSVADRLVSRSSGRLERQVHPRSTRPGREPCY